MTTDFSVLADDTRLRASEAAEFLGVVLETLYEWRRDGLGPKWARKGPYPKSPIAYRLGDLRQWQRDQEHAPQAQRQEAS